MEKFNIKRTSIRGYKIGNMFFTKEVAKEIENEANLILNDIDNADYRK